MADIGGNSFQSNIQKDNTPDILSFIRLHTALSPLGASSIYTIVTNNVVTDKIGEACRTLQINPLYFYPDSDYDILKKTLSEIYNALKEEKTVFFFLNEELFNYLYTELISWRDKNIIPQPASKARFFLIVRADPVAINLEMISQLSDYTLMDNI